MFADGSSGICIRFERSKLIAAIKKQTGTTAKDVEYLTLEDIGKKKLKVDQLPFLKRYPYEDESEFRVIYESKATKKNSLDIAIPLSCIDRIILSPWIPRALTTHVKDTIRDIDGCKSVEVVRSTLISNERWKSFSDGAK